MVLYLVAKHWGLGLEEEIFFEEGEEMGRYYDVFLRN